REDTPADEDFFAQGGDSVAAAQLLAEVERAFVVSLPMSVFLQAPTLPALTKRVQAAGHTGPDSPLVALHPRRQAAVLLRPRRRRRSAEHCRRKLARLLNSKG